MQYIQPQLFRDEPTVTFHGFELPATTVTSELLKAARRSRPVLLVVDLFPTPFLAQEPGPRGLWLVYGTRGRDCGVVSGFLWTPPDCRLVSEHGSVFRDELVAAGTVALQHRPSLQQAACSSLPTSPAALLAALGLQPSPESAEVS